MSTPPSPVPADLPDPESLTDAFDVYEVEVEDGDVRYYGQLDEAEESLVQSVAPTFRDRGYRVRLNYETGEHVLVATERQTSVDGVPWLNVGLFVATVFTTLLAGARWYGLPLGAEPLSILRAWPFSVAVMSVLAVHELGHYALSRYHEVEASLPYFIPIPNPLGTLGAVIRMNDNMPSRRALFDIGVAGPLAGLAVTVVVTAVGVSLPPLDTSATAGATVATQLELGYPLLVQGVAAALGQPLVYEGARTVNPVVVGGWVGAFVTFLNLLPVGQLDGAHVARSLVGDALDRLQLVVPTALFALAGYLFLFEDGRAATIWVLWGVLALVFGRIGGVRPLDDSPVGRGRQAVAVLTLVLGVLCFTPMPVVVTM